MTLPQRELERTSSLNRGGPRQHTASKRSPWQQESDHGLALPTWKVRAMFQQKAWASSAIMAAHSRGFRASSQQVRYAPTKSWRQSSLSASPGQHDGANARCMSAGVPRLPGHFRLQPDSLLLTQHFREWAKCYLQSLNSESPWHILFYFYLFIYLFFY